MRRFVWLLVASGLLLSAAAVWIGIVVTGNKNASAITEQLRLARAEGIPTNAEEFKASIPSAQPDENAALLYRRLPALTQKGIDPQAVAMDLTFNRGPKSQAVAETLLKKHREYLKVVQEAASLRRSWFNRDWANGSAVLMTEFADMRKAARFLGLRGSMAAAKGDSAMAIADAQRIFAIANHAGEEPTEIAGLVRESISLVGLKNLAWWAFVHRNVPAYRQALSQAVDAFPRPDLKEEHRGDLYIMLWLLDNSATLSGRKKMGFKEEVVAPASSVLPFLVSPTKAKWLIIKAERDYWAAFDHPSKQRASLQEEAVTKEMALLIAYPVAESVYRALYSDTRSSTDREKMYEARKQAFAAAARALNGFKTPQAILTKDLLSPFDGKPLSYRFDGKQMVISISGHGEGMEDPMRLAIPPDKGRHY